LRRHLVAGLVVIAPVSITAFVLWWIFQRLDGLLGNIIYPAIGIEIPGLGLLLLLAILLAVGWAAERAVGARVVAWWHTLLERFPLTRRVYTASHRIVRTVFGEEQRFFRDVVLVEYPAPGRWSIGFVTASAPAAIRRHVEDGVTVFIPTTPNPTTGFLVIVPRESVVPIPLTLEQAFTFILSAGGVTPDAPGATAVAPAATELP
jgi:uncharacterized membrane protein